MPGSYAGPSGLRRTVRYLITISFKYWKNKNTGVYTIRTNWKSHHQLLRWQVPGTHLLKPWLVWCSVSH